MDMEEDEFEEVDEFADTKTEVCRGGQSKAMPI